MNDTNQNGSETVDSYEPVYGDEKVYSGLLDDD